MNPLLKNLISINSLIIYIFVIISIFSGIIIGKFSISLIQSLLLLFILVTIFIIIKDIFIGIGIFVASILIEDGIAIFSSTQSITKLLGFTILGLCLFRLIYNNKLVIQFDNKFIVMGIFFIWILISLFNASNIEIGLNRVTSLFQMLITYFILINIIENENDLKKIFLIFVITGIMVAIYSLFYGQDTVEQASYYGSDLQRVMGTGKDPNKFAQNFLLLIPLGFYLSLFKNKLFYLVVGLFIVTIIATFSRGALIGLLFVIITSLIVIYNSFVNKTKLLYMIISVLVLISSVLYFNKKTGGVLLERATHRDGSVSTRMELIDIAIDMGIKNPIWGVGIGNFDINSHLYGKAYHFGRASHNGFLEIFASLGFPGLIFFVVIIFLTCYELWIASKFSASDNKESKSLYQFILIAFISFLITGFFLGLLMNKFFWILLAFATVSNRIVNAKMDKSNFKIS